MIDRRLDGRNCPSFGSSFGMGGLQFLEWRTEMFGELVLHLVGNFFFLFRVLSLFCAALRFKILLFSFSEKNQTNQLALVFYVLLQSCYKQTLILFHGFIFKWTGMIMFRSSCRSFWHKFKFIVVIM